MRISPFFRGSAASVIIQGVKVGFQAVAAILLARILGAEKYGQYSFAMALVLFLQLPIEVGLRNVAVRYSAAYVERKLWSYLCGLNRRLIQWSTLYSCIVGIALVLLAFNFDGVAQRAGSSRVIAASACIIAFFPTAAMLGGQIRGMGYKVLGQVPEFALRPMIFGLLCFLAWLYIPTSLSPVQAMLLNAGSALVALFGAIFLYYLVRPTRLSQQQPEFQSSMWLSSMLPMAITGGMLVVNAQIAILTLGWWSSAIEVGQYQASNQIASLVSLGIIAINRLIGPDISRLYVAERHKKLQELLAKAARLALISAMPLVIFFLIGGHWALRYLLGAGYAQSYLVLGVLAIGQLINVMAGSVGYVLNMTGYEKDALAGFVTGGIINVMFLIFLVPSYGALGAAFSTAFGFLAWNIFLIWRVYKRTGLDTTALGGSIWGFK